MVMDSEALIRQSSSTQMSRSLAEEQSDSTALNQASEEQATPVG